MRSNGGFSLVECLVAAVVLATGLLAIVASERAIQRLDLLARRTAEVAEAAAGRLALMRATGCAGAASGSASAALSEDWSVSGSGALRAATVTVTWRQGAQVRGARFDETLFCGDPP